MVTRAGGVGAGGGEGAGGVVMGAGTRLSNSTGCAVSALKGRDCS